MNYQEEQEHTRKLEAIDVDLVFTNAMTKWSFVSNFVITCPHCESQFKDLGKPDGLSEMRCPECHEHFTLSVTTKKTYRTSPGLVDWEEKRRSGS
jgi:transposase-like protein